MITKIKNGITLFYPEESPVFKSKNNGIYDFKKTLDEEKKEALYKLIKRMSKIDNKKKLEKFLNDINVSEKVFFNSFEIALKNKDYVTYPKESKNNTLNLEVLIILSKNIFLLNKLSNKELLIKKAYIYDDSLEKLRFNHNLKNPHSIFYIINVFFKDKFESLNVIKNFHKDKEIDDHVYSESLREMLKDVTNQSIHKHPVVTNLLKENFEYYRLKCQKNENFENELFKLINEPLMLINNDLFEEVRKITNLNIKKDINITNIVFNHTIFKAYVDDIYHQNEFEKINKLYGSKTHSSIINMLLKANNPRMESFNLLLKKDFVKTKDILRSEDKINLLSLYSMDTHEVLSFVTETLPILKERFNSIYLFDKIPFFKELKDEEFYLRIMDYVKEHNYLKDPVSLKNLVKACLTYNSQKLLIAIFESFRIKDKENIAFAFINTLSFKGKKNEEVFKILFSEDFIKKHNINNNKLLKKIKNTELRSLVEKRLILDNIPLNSEIKESKIMRNRI